MNRLVKNCSRLIHVTQHVVVPVISAKMHPKESEMSLHPGLVECNHSLQGGEVITEQLKCLLDDGTQVQSTASHLSISSVGFTADGCV